MFENHNLELGVYCFYQISTSPPPRHFTLLLCSVIVFKAADTRSQTTQQALLASLAKEIMSESESVAAHFVSLPCVVQHVFIHSKRGRRPYQWYFPFCDESSGGTDRGRENILVDQS